MITPPRAALTPAVFALASLLVFGACDRTPVQPDASLGVVPGRYVQTVGGFLLSQAKLQEVYDRLTRDVAVALQDPDVRSMVYQQLHASPYPQHKLHFRTFVTKDGQALLDAIAEHRHVLP